MTLGREQDTAGVSTRSRQDGGLIWLIWFVLLIWLVSFNQINQMDEPTAFLCRLDHFPEVVDCTMEGIFQLYLRLPFQDSTSPTDIGPSDLGIIGWQRMVGDGAC